MGSSPIVVVADRGTVKTYKVWHTPSHGPQLELLEQHGFSQAHQSLQDQTADQSGTLSDQGSDGHSNSNSDQHRFETETEGRGIKAVAQTISNSVRKARPLHWYLACPSEVHAELVKRIPNSLRAGLHEVIKADLTHSPTSEIIRHLGTINS
jgi:hypothetical protein